MGPDDSVDAFVVGAADAAAATATVREKALLVGAPLALQFARWVGIPTAVADSCRFVSVWVAAIGVCLEADAECQVRLQFIEAGAGPGDRDTVAEPSADAPARLVVQLVYRRAARAVLVLSAGRAPPQSWHGIARLAGRRIADVTAFASALIEKEAAEGAAEEQAALLRAVVESAPDIVMHVDPKGRIRFVNRVVEGFRREDVVGAEWLAFVAADQHEQVTRLLQQTLATGRTTECEVLGQGDHGAPSWYWTRIAPVRHDGAITGAVLVARDITEMKLAETQLIVSDRMASLGSVVASVTHELNNSLASVVVNLELAFHDVSNLTPAVVPPELPEMLQDARDGAERVRQTVHDLRIFSRHEQDERCAVNVERVLDSTLRMAVNEIRHRARLVTSYAGVPLVDGSEGQLGHVFLNLIMNAAHAIPEGNFETNEISVTTELDATGRVLVTIAGSGPCVPADVPQRPFTPFFSATPPRPGTGLNLSIYQRIVTSLAGELSFERPSDRGTVFRVLLQRPTSSANTELATSRQLLPTRRGRVLIVDDEPAFARTFKRVLAGEHDVSISHSASGALEAFAAGQRFDVVLCDLMMPQVTGMDFFAALAGIDAEQARRVVFMTGGAFTSKARDFLASVPNQSFEKPLDLESLRAIVRSLVK